MVSIEWASIPRNYLTSLFTQAWLFLAWLTASLPPPTDPPWVVPGRFMDGNASLIDSIMSFVYLLGRIHSNSQSKDMSKVLFLQCLVCQPIWHCSKIHASVWGFSKSNYPSLCRLWPLRIFVASSAQFIFYTLASKASLVL